MLKFLKVVSFIGDVVFIATVAVIVVWLLAGCASSRHNTTYANPPADYQGRQTPHSIP